MKYKKQFLLFSLCMLAALLPKAVSAKTIDVQNLGDLRAAVNSAADGDTIALKGSAMVQDTNSDAAPWVINKRVTITGGTVNLRAGGIILGNDVTFKDTQLLFANPVRNVIAANGYTLTLDNATRATNSTGQGMSNQVHMFCGGMSTKSGNQVSSAVLPNEGPHGKVIVRGDKNTKIELGNIYAGNISTDGSTKEFTKPATIDVDVKRSGSKIGMTFKDSIQINGSPQAFDITEGIYGSGALQTPDPGLTLDPNFVVPPPTPRTDLSPVSGHVEMRVTEVGLRNVFGDTGKDKKAAVVFNGGVYLASGLNFNSMDSLSVESGMLELLNSTDLSKTKLELKNGGKLSLTKFKSGDTKIGGLNGDGGRLVLNSYQKVVSSGAVTGSAKVSLGEMSINFDESKEQPRIGHEYISGPTSSNATFDLLPYNNQTNIKLVNENGKWIARDINAQPAPLEFTDSDAYNIPASQVGVKIKDISVKGGVKGGKAPYTFSATGLPSGISISSNDGVITGTPTKAQGATTATITVTDSLKATKSITINVGAITDKTPQPTPLEFTDSDAYNIPAGQVGVKIKDISVKGGVKGGQAPYTFSATGLPSGISISSNDGVISGTPTKAQGATTATITVTDNLKATKSITINVGAITDKTPQPTPLEFTDSPAYDIPASQVGVKIKDISVKGGVKGGQAPYTFSAAGLPSGISISSNDGVISGTPTKAQNTTTATITVTDNLKATKSITINVGAIKDKTPQPTPSLSAPTGVKAAAVNNMQIKLSWQGVSGAQGYDIYRSTSQGGSYAKVGNSSSTSYTDSGLAGNTQYFYKVKAYAKSGSSNIYSPDSAAVNSKTYANPALTGLTAPSTSNIGSSVSLQATMTGYTTGVQYRFLWSNGSKSGVVRDFSTSNAASFKLTMAGKYVFTVQAKLSNGQVLSKTANTNSVDPYYFAVNRVIAPSKINVGQQVSIKVDVSGNTSGLQYKFVWQKDNWKQWGVIRDFSATNIAAFRIQSPGSYEFIVDVQGKNGQVITKKASTIGVEQGFNVNSVNVASSGIKGRNVDISANVTGDTSGLKYKFVWSWNNWQRWGVIKDFSSTNKATFKLPYEGNIDFIVDVQAPGGKVISKVGTTKVINENDFAFNGVVAPAKGKVGETIKVGTSVTGNSKDLRYKFVWSCNNWEKWGVFKGMSYDNSASLLLRHPGKYDIIVDVEGVNGSITTKKTTMIVEPNWNVSGIEASATRVKAGTPVPLKGLTSGDTNGLQYKFVWSWNNWTDWGVLRAAHPSKASTFLTYAKGDFTIYMDVIDQYGNVKTVTRNITVY